MATDGTVTSTFYNSADATGSVVAVDQENVDGTSTITTFGADGSSSSITYTGPDGTGSPGPLTLSNAGTFSPGDTIDTPTTVTLGTSSVVFPATRVPFPGTAQTLPLLGIPVTVSSGAFEDINSSSSADGAFALQQIGGFGTYGVGTYPVGSQGSLVVGEQTDQAGSFSDALPVTIYPATGGLDLSGTINVSGVVYAPAVATYDEPLEFGQLHVGDTRTLNVSYTNTATPGAYTDNLEVGGFTLSTTSAKVGNSTSPYFTATQTGSLDLAPGQTGSLKVTLTALQPGFRAIAGGPVIPLASHDSAQADVALPFNYMQVAADIYGYASPQVSTSGQPAQVTRSGNTYVVDLGTITPGSFPAGVNILLNNGPPFTTGLDEQINYVDSLGGSFTYAGSGFGIYENGNDTVTDTLSGTSSFLLEAAPDTSMSGSHTETVTISPTSDDSFSTTALPTITVEIVDSVACYVRGTLIRTEGGQVPVEALAAGDRVVTASGERRPVRWIGRRSYGGPFLAANPNVQPIRFFAGSLGDGLPRRDLLVSPEHAMFLDGVLVPAKLLVNGETVVQETGLATVDYFHVELDSHDVLLAEDAPSESFVDCDSRGMFQNAHTFAGTAPRWSFCAPRVEDGPVLARIRDRLRPRRSAAALSTVRGHLD